jgi:phospholipid/cholesterol/gamma-HCH transport system ATP-binding protein
MLHTLSPAAQQAIRTSREADRVLIGAGAGRHAGRDAPTQQLPRLR